MFTNKKTVLTGLATAVALGTLLVSNAAFSQSTLVSRANANGFADTRQDASQSTSGCSALVSAAARAHCEASVVGSTTGGSSFVNSGTEATTSPYVGEARAIGQTTATAERNHFGSIQTSCSAGSMGGFGASCRSGGYVSFGGYDRYGRYVPSGTGSRTSAHVE